MLEEFRSPPAARPMQPPQSAGTVPSGGAKTGRSGSDLVRLAARRWRQLRFAAAFAQFGAAALVVAFIVTPLVRLRSRTKEESELGVQRATRRAYAFSVACWQWIGLVRVDSRPLAALEEPTACVIVANHPTLIDVVLLGSHLGQMDCIVNPDWASNPFLARASDAAGYVRNDGGHSVIDACVARLQRGRRLLVFPEGTRSPWGSFGRFQRGAAHISLASGAPIVVVTIRCRPRLLGSGRKWSDVPERTSRFEMRIAGRLDPASYIANGASAPIAARRMTEDMLRMFLEEPNLADS